MLNDGHFRTTELSLAVALSLHGYTPVLERRGSGQKVLFCFNPRDAGRDSELADLVTEFESDELLVEPKAFVIAQKRLREQLYDLLGVRKKREIQHRI